MFPSVRTSDAPNAAALQKRYDYDANGNLIYEGWGSPGALSSAAAWAIKKNTFALLNGTYQLTVEQYPTLTGPEFTAIWDNRAALAYS